MGHWSSELLFFSGSPADPYMPGFGGVGCGGWARKATARMGLGNKIRLTLGEGHGHRHNRLLDNGLKELNSSK